MSTRLSCILLAALAATVPAATARASGPIARVSTEALGCHHTTILAAITAAPSNSTIFVMEGAYTENWGAVAAKNLTLVPTPVDSPCNVESQGRVSVNAGGLDRLVFLTGSMLTLRRFDIVDGATPIGGQFSLESSNLILDDSTATHGLAGSGGSVHGCSPAESWRSTRAP